MHAQGELKVLSVESKFSAEFDFCGIEFSFYPDGKRFVGFGAVSSPGSGAIYLVAVVVFFLTRQRQPSPGKTCGLNNIGVDPVIHYYLYFRFRADPVKARISTDRDCAVEQSGLKVQEMYQTKDKDINRSMRRLRVDRRKAVKSITGKNFR